jgi:3',5'-cyclic AMP phosphodiesterase CpdA
VRDERDGCTREDAADRELGMHASITRRDVLHGMGAAAYYFRKAAGKSARILILDNHDDFGGVAIANADAAWKPYIDAAIDEARRAVGELVEAGLV